MKWPEARSDDRYKLKNDRFITMIGVTKCRENSLNVRCVPESTQVTALKIVWWVLRSKSTTWLGGFCGIAQHHIVNRKQLQFHWEKDCNCPIATVGEFNTMADTSVHLRWETWEWNQCKSGASNLGTSFVMSLNSFIDSTLTYVTKKEIVQGWGHYFLGHLPLGRQGNSNRFDWLPRTGKWL